ncbi:hypothetical protein IAQ61_004160 [Plenodomus lingam]|uniref:Predicted protein n=1 Tax=Leptosphaeria maculans (strain JN3 / isolate v23.1.3 / race Av1-4-5-6-7-8) TaxID=985895 RepID=E4ZXD0_LEPMJ|nr:predicted protein [Plenodomus lingam JN3]KAH9873536.1 hypothetical protein IAQ61_004160 [Plenodomus lingam]CBX95340.1 predicted protein [Plenodomus lingam JN3]
MKYSAVLLFAVGAFATPQDPTVTNAPASPSPPSGLTGPVSCALACDAGDVNCQAACLGNARPNASQAIATNECAARCDQGDGTPAATDAYAKCVSDCISNLFPSSQTGVLPNVGPAPVAPTSTASAAGSPGSGPVATASEKPTGASGSSPSPSGAGASGSAATATPEATGAADKNSARIAGAGLAGLLALFAL